MKCTFCGSQVDEDESAGPQSDSRQTLAKFNDQMRPLYDKLLAVENIRLDPSVLEPEPAELGPKGSVQKAGPAKPTVEGGKWSGEATRGIGLRAEEQDIKIDFGQESREAEATKDVPVWITQSTVAGVDNLQITNEDSSSNLMMDKASDNKNKRDDHAGGSNNGDDDEITKLLLQHEKRNSAASAAAAASSIAKVPDSDSDNKSDDSDMDDVSTNKMPSAMDNVENMSSDDDADDGIPTVRVGNEEITVTDVNEDIINRMTAEEKERYTQIFQDFYSHMYD